MSITITQVRDDLLSKLGYEILADAPPLALQDVVVAVNGALQMLQTAGEDFFTRTHLGLGIAAGTAMYSLGQSVQAIIGPVSLADGTRLLALASSGEYDQFDRIYLGSSSYGAAAGTPMAYFVENVFAPGKADANQINLWLAPVPNAPQILDVEVILDATAYGVADLTNGSALPIAQRYVESVFLPIARMLVTRSSQFSRPTILPGITSDYQAAMATLAAKGGFPPAVQPEADRKTKG